ncbi:MAG: transposase [Actinomycetota bacterium]|nr:transposase [Actinomycetota bacterium]
MSTAGCTLGYWTWPPAGPRTPAGSNNSDPAFIAGLKQTSLDPFRVYANAIRDELPDAVAVLDAFHVVKLGTQVVDEVRRRVQHATQGRRGHKDDPLYKIRGLLRLRSEHLSDTQIAAFDAHLLAGDPTWEVTLAWHC